MGQWIDLLPEGSLIYGSLDAKTNQAFLKELVQGNKDLDDVLKRTQRIYYSINGIKNQAWDYKILLLGDYPSGWVGLYLDWQKSFIKHPGPPAQWQFKNLLYVYQPENGAILASPGIIPPQNLGTRSVVPEQTALAMDSFDLFIYMPHPAQVITGAALGATIPLESLSGYFRTTDQGWSGEAVASLGDERATRFVTLGIKMLLGGWAKTTEDPKTQEMWRSIELKQEGLKIILSNIHIPRSFLITKLQPLLEENS